jgi:Cys-tRNA synthase (O-phospho-L-seryl-tRNA:Cys-tRNA synthase)
MACGECFWCVEYTYNYGVSGRIERRFACRVLREQHDVNPNNDVESWGCSAFCTPSEHLLSSLAPHMLEVLRREAIELEKDIEKAIDSVTIERTERLNSIKKIISIIDNPIVK